MKKIENKWTSTITTNHHPIALQSFYHSSKEDPATAELLPQIGFRLDHEKQVVQYPKDPWSFLQKNKAFLNNQDGILPSIAIYKTGTKEFKFITDVSELPEQSSLWEVVSNELDGLIYYQALSEGKLPITLSINYEDHEFQHLITFYHPTNFPHYMNATKKMAKRYVQKELSDKMVFIFLESFSFVRPETEESFESLLDRWDIDATSFKDIQNTLDKIDPRHLALLSEQFLVLFPKLVIHLGGLVRESQLLPLKTNPLNFLTHWPSARNNHKNSIERFVYQNWRTLYTNLALAHNFCFSPANYGVLSAHSGISIRTLEDHQMSRSPTIEMNKLSYLKMGLAELIWAIHLSYKLNLTASEVLTAATGENHPDYEKVRTYFENAYASVYNGAVLSSSIYVHAFKEQEAKQKLMSILSYKK